MGSRVILSLLAIAALASCGVALAAEDFPDVIAADLSDALAAFDDGAKKLGDALLADFEKQIKVAASAGKLEDVERIQAERDAFSENATLPSVRSMQASRAKYERELKRLQKARLDAYDAAITKFTKAELFDEAKAIRDAKRDLQASAPPKPSDINPVRGNAKVAAAGGADDAKKVLATTKDGRDNVFYHCMLNQYATHFKGDQPFFSLSLPKANLWTEGVQRQMRGQIDLANIECTGRGWLVVPHDDVYTIVNPAQLEEGFVYIDGKSPGYQGGDISLKKGVYEVTFKAGTYGRDELTRCRILIVNKMSKLELPIVCTEAEIKSYFETRPEGYKMIEHERFKLTTVRLDKEIADLVVKAAGDRAESK